MKIIDFSILSACLNEHLPTGKIGLVKGKCLLLKYRIQSNWFKMISLQEDFIGLQIQRGLYRKIGKNGIETLKGVKAYKWHSI